MSSKDREFHWASRGAYQAALADADALRDAEIEFRARNPDWAADPKAAEQRRQARCRLAFSPDPVAAGVRAQLLLTQDADEWEETSTGPRRKREVLMALLLFVERRGHKLGIMRDANGAVSHVGTAEKGKLVKEAAQEMHLSPARVRDLARQLADLAGTLPGGVIGR